MRPVMRPAMRTAMTIEATAGRESVEFAVEAEKLGLDICWVAEAWGADAPSPLGYLAARTESMLLGSGVIQVGTRSPVTIAQTAMTLAHLSDGRFLLGLGASGPQVIEGLHGIPFGHPLARMRETVAIVRSGEVPLHRRGQLGRPGQEEQPVDHRVPVGQDPRRRRVGHLRVRHLITSGGLVVDVVVSDGDPRQHGAAVGAPLDDEQRPSVRLRETPRERVRVGDLVDAEPPRPWDFTAVRASGKCGQQMIADGGQEQCAVFFGELGKRVVKARSGPVLQR